MPARSALVYLGFTVLGATVAWLAAGRRARARGRALHSSGEEKFRAIVENTPDVIARLDRDLRHLYVNPSITRYFPFPAEQWVGRTLREMGAPPDLCDVWEGAMRAVFEDAQPRELDYTTPTPVGPRDFSWRVFAEHDERGGVHAIVVLAQDITERRRLENQFLHAQKLEAVARLAGGIAHDFNNILTAMTGHAALAADRLPAGHPAHEDLDEILAATERATRLTRHLLAFSRRQVFQMRPLDLNDAVRACDHSVSRVLGSNVQLELQLHAAPVPVLADPAQIEEMVFNLCENARDAMPEGGTITIATSITEGHAELRVSDVGTGIAAHALGHIFEPFYSTKDASHGAGLGLPIVYGLAQQAGGEVRVESTPGKGSTFRVLLPLNHRETAPSRTLATATESGITVLVAEDEDGVRRLLRRTFTARGYVVLTARHGQEALSLFREHAEQVSVVLSDVVMPGMGGRELAQELRRLRPRLPIILMTGYTTDAELHDALLEDGVHLITKPFSPSDVVRLIEQLARG